MSDETPSPARPRNRLVWAIDIVLVRLRFIGLLVVVMLIAAYWDDIKSHVERWLPHESAANVAGAADVEYFCPMHPQIVRGEPGNCPICGMPLSKRKKGEAATLPEGVTARVQFSPFRIAQGGIRTSPVEWRPLEREIETVGFVDYDERKLARITTRFAGRVESLAVDFTGTSVERGAPLATLYSPEVFAAEQSFISAGRAFREVKAAAGSDAATADRARVLADAARSRLVLWGVDPEQLDAIEKRGWAAPRIDVLAPISGVVTKKSVVVGDYVAEGASLFDVADLSTVWVKARVYEDDLGLVAVGRKIVATAAAYAGETFEGDVVFVDPFLDRATRTADLRVDLPNPGGRLKPGMYVNAAVRVPFAEIEPYKSMTRPAAIGPTDVLVVPETAVVDTGRRKVVYVESSPGVFDAREVVLGPRAGVYYPIVKGLDAGMRVATAGSFLIDAETRLNPAAAGTYFGASGATPAAGHEGHGK